jgi:hypothetical protein
VLLDQLDFKARQVLLVLLVFKVAQVPPEVAGQVQLDSRGLLDQQVLLAYKGLLVQ